MSDERIPALPVAASRRRAASSPVSDGGAGNVSGAKIEGEQAQVQVEDGPKGVGGALALFCVALTILTPAWSLIQMTITWQQAKPAFDQFPALKTAVLFENLGCVVLLIYGFVVGCTVMSGSPSGQTVAKQYLLIRLLSGICIELIALIMIGDLPSNVTSGVGGAVARGIIWEGVYFLIWWFYFKNSKRVRNTYGDENSLPVGKPDCPPNFQWPLPPMPWYASLPVGKPDCPPNTTKVEEEPIAFAPSASRHLEDEHITALPVAATTSATDGEWYVIRAGKEVGPLSLAELVGKAAMGEIEADDLVKLSDGLWTKARGVGFLQQQFLLANFRKKPSQGTFENLLVFLGISRFQGELLVFGACLLLVVVVSAVVWAINRPANTDREVLVANDARVLPSPPPDVRMYMKSDNFGYLRGTVHNETGKTIEKLKLSIKTDRWQRIYEVKVRVENNASASFSVFVGEEQLEAQSFSVLTE
jgi:hypothetical protein